MHGGRDVPPLGLLALGLFSVASLPVPTHVPSVFQRVSSRLLAHVTAEELNQCGRADPLASFTDMC